MDPGRTIRRVIRSILGIGSSVLSGRDQLRVATPPAADLPRTRPAPNQIDIPPDIRIVALSDLIIELGIIVRDHWPDLTEVQQQLIDAILRVDDWCERRELNMWESETLELVDEQAMPGTVDRLLYEIVALGWDQLYCGFQPDRVYRQYQSIRNLCESLGLPVPEDAASHCWHINR